MTTETTIDWSQALSADDPRAALMELALSLRTQGKSQEEVAALFSEELERACEDDSRWRDEGHLGDVLDMMVDYFVPSSDNHPVKTFITQFRAPPE